MLKHDVSCEVFSFTSFSDLHWQLGSCCLLRLSISKLLLLYCKMSLVLHFSFRDEWVFWITPIRTQRNSFTSSSKSSLTITIPPCPCQNLPKSHWEIALFAWRLFSLTLHFAGSHCRWTQESTGTRKGRLRLPLPGRLKVLAVSLIMLWESASVLQMRGRTTVLHLVVIYSWVIWKRLTLDADQTTLCSTRNA